MHYSRWKVHGDPLKGARRQQAEQCSEKGCDRRPLAKDLCRRHYYERRRTARRKPRPPELPPARCSVEDCERDATVRGWCGAHYQRWRRYGDATFVPPQADKRCTVEGCGRVTNARGLCGPHYYRWQRYGDPLSGQPVGRVTTLAPLPLRRCATCGAPFDPGTSRVRKYCNRRCRPSRANHGVNTRATVERLARAYGWACAICEEEIDSTIYWPDTAAGSVDHITPVAQGGNDDWGNLQLAHLRCNLEKGAS